MSRSHLIRTCFAVPLVAVLWAPLRMQDKTDLKNDPCLQISVPTLSDQQAKAILKRRSKIDCDKIYDNRKSRLDVAIGNAQARLVDLMSDKDISGLTEQAHLIGLKEKVLCLDFKSIPEVTEEFRRCRQRQLDDWERDIITSVRNSQEADRNYGKTTVGKAYPDPASKRERLTEALIRSLERNFTDGVEIKRRMEEDELGRSKIRQTSK